MTVGNNEWSKCGYHFQGVLSPKRLSRHRGVDTVCAGLSRLTTVTREQQQDSGTQSLSQSITVVQARGSSLKITLKKTKPRKGSSGYFYPARVMSVCLQYSGPTSTKSLNADRIKTQIKFHSTLVLSAYFTVCCPRGQSACLSEDHVIGQGDHRTKMGCPS